MRIPASQEVAQPWCDLVVNFALWRPAAALWLRKVLRFAQRIGAKIDMASTVI